jgi:tetratricopeptide (TPR) repeat protein
VKQKKNRKEPPRKEAQKPPLPQPTAPLSRSLIVYALILLALAAVPYLNTLSNAFVLDDIGIIVDNPLVREVGNVGTIFTTNYWSRGQKGAAGGIDPGLYRPLTVFSYAIDYKIGKLDPTGYHVVNIALHAGATLLLFLIAVELLGSAAAGFAAAAIFAVHPIHTEAVSSIVGRAEVLATFFFMLAFYFGRLPRSGTPFVVWRAAASTAAAGICYLLGLFSKETAVTLPALLLVHDWIRREDFLGTPQRRKAPGAVPLGFVVARYGVFVLAAGVYFLFRTHAVTSPSNIWVGWVGVTAPRRIFTASRVLMEYLGLLVFPYTLSAEYWGPGIRIASSLFDPAVLLSVLLWIAVGYLAVWSLRRAPPLFFSLAWFFGTVLPVSNFFFPIGIGKAERIVYLASAGFCLCIGWLCEKLERKLEWKPLLMLLLVPVLSAFALRTWVRNFDWKDDLALALSTLREFPNSPLMSNRAGQEYHKRGDKEKALAYLEQSVRERPDSAIYRMNLAEAYDADGRRADAIREYRTALQIDPNSAEAHTALGAIYFAGGQIDPAIEEFKASIRLRPDISDTHSNLGGLYLSKNSYEDAMREFDTALKLNPNNPEARNNLGTAYLRTGRFDLAVEQYRRALALKPDYPDARENLKIAEQALGAAPKRR